MKKHGIHIIADLYSCKFNKIEKLNINNLKKKLFWFLTVSLFFSIIFYTYLVNQTVLNIVERENIQDEITTLNSKISELEFRYIALKNNINLEYAHSLGFVNVKNVKFASRKLSGNGLSINFGVNE